MTTAIKDDTLSNAEQQMIEDIVSKELYGALKRIDELLSKGLGTDRFCEVMLTIIPVTAISILTYRSARFNVGYITPHQLPELQVRIAETQIRAVFTGIIDGLTDQLTEFNKNDGKLPEHIQENIARYNVDYTEVAKATFKALEDFAERQNLAKQV